jgi:nucleoid DNA-binding protein
MAGKVDIVEFISSNVEGINKKQAGAALEATVQAISSQLAKGERVQIPGFGSFSVSERAARTGRNPKTGQSIKIAASKNVRFKAGKDLKDGINKKRR